MGHTMPASCCKTIAKPLHPSRKRRRDARDEASRRQGGHSRVDRFPTLSGRAKGSGARQPQLVQRGNAQTGELRALNPWQSSRAGLTPTGGCCWANPQVAFMLVGGVFCLCSSQVMPPPSDCLCLVKPEGGRSVVPGVTVGRLGDGRGIQRAHDTPSSRRGAVGGVSAPRAGPTAWFVESCIGSCRRGRRRSRSRSAC